MRAFVILPFRQNMFSEEYNLTYLLHIEVFLYVFYWQTSHITSFCEFQQTLIRKSFFVGEWSYCKITSRNNTGTDSLSELDKVFNVCPEVEFLDNGEMKTSSAETGNVYWAMKGDSLHINSFLQIGSTSLPDNIYHIQVKDSDSTGIELTTIDKKITYYLSKRI